MAWSVRSARTALLKCEACHHSSLLELEDKGWLARLLHYTESETRVRAKCSNCGSSTATLIRRGEERLLPRLLHLYVGIAGVRPNTGILRSE